MATEADKNLASPVFQVFAPTPQFQNQAPPVFYYQPQPAVSAQTLNDEALARQIQQQEIAGGFEVQQGSEKSSGGCRRGFWGRWRRCGRDYQRLDGEKSRGCCWKDDGRPLGNLTNFIQGVLFGTFAPLFGLLAVFGFETSKLARTGVLFGTANFLLIFASAMAAFGFHHCPKSRLFALIPFFIGLIFLIAAKKSFRWFLYVYRTRENKTESEEVKTFAGPGKCCGFILALLASLLFSLLGTFVALIAGRRSLRARFGAFIGLGISLVGKGIYLSVRQFHFGPGVILLGLLLMQISAAHFKRAIASAQAKVEATNEC